MISRYFPLEEYEIRWKRVHEAMQAHALDVAVVWSRSAGTYDRCADLLYLTNYYGNQPGQGRRGPAGLAALVMRRNEPPELFADVQDPRRELVATGRVHACENTFEAVAEFVRGLGSRRVGLIGSDIIPMKYWLYLRDRTPNIDWFIADELVREVRLLKSPRELDAFRQAGLSVSAALTAVMKTLAGGGSEAEAAAAGGAIVLRGGGHIHMLAVSHGPYLSHIASDPLVGFSQIRPAPGDLARAWITGPMFQGYWLGPGRTVVCAATPNADQRTLLGATAAAVDAIIAKVRSGVTVRELVEVGDRHVQAFGGEPSAIVNQWPLFGHGNGLFFEAPTISTRVGSDAEFVLRANMVISIEVFLSRAGIGEAGFENNVIVTDTGTELLSRSLMLL